MKPLQLSWAILLACMTYSHCSSLHPGLLVAPINQDISVSPKATVESAAFSHDEKRVAFLYTDGKILLREVSSNKIQQTLQHQGYGSRSLVFSPDDKTLAVGAFREMILWNLGTGQALIQGVGEGFSSVAFSPDGKRLLFSSMMGVQALAVPTRTLVSVSFARAGYRLAYSPDGKMIAGDIENAPGSWKSDVGLWEARTGKLKFILPGDTQWGGPCLFLDNARVITFEDDGRLKVWSVQTGKLLGLLKDTSPDRNIEKAVEGPAPDLLATMQDGKTIASAHRGSIFIWNAQTGKLCRKLSEPEIVGLAFSRDGNWLLTANSEGRIKRWDMRTGQDNADSKPPFLLPTNSVDLH